MKPMAPMKPMEPLKFDPPWWQEELLAGTWKA
jgi:hypothetical protein